MKTQMIELVLDSSAVLAWFRDEPGGSEAGEAMARALISTVNLAEVVSKLVENGHDPEEAIELAREIPCRSVPFDEEMAMTAGALRGVTRRHGLSLGDRACLALARAENCPVLTADRVWSRLEVGVEIRMLR